MFLSCEGALHWAYSISARPIIKMAVINNMRQGPGYRYPNELLDDLNVQDRHGQAALIIGLVDSLSDPAAQEFVKARFGRRTGQEDIRHLVYRGCEALGLGLEKQNVVYRIMRSYFFGEMGIRTIMREMGCRHQYAIMTRNCLFDLLDIINLQAMSEMTQMLRERGLIEASRYG